MTGFDALPTVRFADGTLRIIDQTQLPWRYQVIALDSVERVCEAIRLLRVRGAPAIGVAAAYGLLVALEEAFPGEPALFASGIDDAGTVSAPRVTRVPDTDPASVQSRLEAAARSINATRPTAVNLGWALARMRCAWKSAASTAELMAVLVNEADAILAEDLAMGRALTAHGAACR